MKNQYVIEMLVDLSGRRYPMKFEHLEDPEPGPYPTDDGYNTSPFPIYPLNIYITTLENVVDILPEKLWYDPSHFWVYPIPVFFAYFNEEWRQLIGWHHNYPGGERMFLGCTHQEMPDQLDEVKHWARMLVKHFGRENRPWEIERANKEIGELKQ